jgi:hypothetical protein
VEKNFNGYWHFPFINSHAHPSQSRVVRPLVVSSIINATQFRKKKKQIDSKKPLLQTKFSNEASAPFENKISTAPQAAGSPA